MGGSPGGVDVALNTISKPERTLERGYGHALDRVILLGALLRADGHDTELLFTTSNTPLPDEINELLYELPRRSSFIMPVLRILPKKSFWGKDKGDVFYLGDGDQYTPLGASSFDKRFYLNPKNTTEEKQIHVQPQFSDRSEENISIRLEPNGDTVIQISRFYHGTAYASFRKHYTETPPEELRREFLETINGYSRGAEMISRPVINTESYPGRFHLKFRAPKYATVGDVAMTLLLPRSPTLPLPLRSDRRHSPLMTTGTIPSYSSISVTIGNGVTPIIAPKPYEYILPGAGGRIRSSVSLPTVPFANVVLVATSTDFTKPVLFPPEFYPTLLDINRRLAHPERRTLVIPLPNEISPTPQPQPPHHP